MDVDKSHDDLYEAEVKARLALLAAITDSVQKGSTVPALRLAEALAWITSPAQSHGGTTNVEVSK